MSQSLAAKNLDDEEIRLGASNSLGSYYRLGKKITVRVSGRNRVCLTCIQNECCHTRRLDEFLRDNPEVVAA